MIVLHTRTAVIDLHGLAEGPPYQKIRIPDIAYSLAHQCRFNGHTAQFYSVAEHSILVHSLAKESFPAPGDAVLRLYALYHDGHEGITGDVISPVKTKILNGVLAKLEHDIDQNIWRVLRIPPPSEAIRALIHEYDLCVAMHERDFAFEDWQLDKGFSRWPDSRIQFLSPTRARQLFMELTVKELTCLRS